MMVAKVAVARAAAPRMNPPQSRRPVTGSACSGSTMAAATRATAPKARLNQKTARHDQKPTRHATDHRTEGEGQPGDGRPDAEGPGPPFPVGVEMADHRKRPGLGGRGSEPHHHPPDDELRGGGGHRGHHRSHAEDAHPDQHQPLAAEQVTQRPANQHERGEGQGIPAHHPLELGDPGVEAGLDVGQGGADDGVVQEGQEQDGHQHGHGQVRPLGGQLLAGIRAEARRIVGVAGLRRIFEPDGKAADGLHGVQCCPFPPSGRAPSGRVEGCTPWPRPRNLEIRAGKVVDGGRTVGGRPRIP